MTNSTWWNDVRRFGAFLDEVRRDPRVQRTLRRQERRRRVLLPAWRGRVQRRRR